MLKNRFAATGLGIFALVMACAATRYIMIESRKAFLRESAEKISLQINNPEVEVSVLGDMVFLKGYEMDEAYKARHEIHAQAILSEKRFWEWSAPPQVKNLIEVKVALPKKTAGR